MADEGIDIPLSPEEAKLMAMLEAAENEEDANKILASLSFSEQDAQKIDQQLLNDEKYLRKSPKPSKKVKDAELSMQKDIDKYLEEEEEEEGSTDALTKEEQRKLLAEAQEGIEEENVEESEEAEEEEADYSQVEKFSDFTENVPLFKDPSIHLAPLKVILNRQIFAHFLETRCKRPRYVRQIPFALCFR